MKEIEKREVGQFVEYRYFNKSKGVYILFQCKKKNVIEDTCLLPEMFKYIWMDNAFEIKGVKKWNFTLTGRNILKLTLEELR